MAHKSKGSRWVLLLLLCLTSAEVIDDQPYCALRYRRLCQGKGRHVACQYPAPGPGLSCKNYTQIKFTNELRHFITHYINRRRQRIASGNERVRGGAFIPKPEIMMMAVWDRELTLLAQRLADQCNFIHDDCRATVRYPYAGQTVGEVRWRRSKESDSLSAQRAIRRVLDAWWGEKRRVQPVQLSSPFRLGSKSTVWGHFSQLAVWTLNAVGCGASRHGSSQPRLLLVCDFSHTNMLGQRTINPGPLAPCPVHTRRRPRSPYPLLCAPVRKLDQSEAQADDNAEEKLYEDYGSDALEDIDLTEKVKVTKSTRPERVKVESNMLVHKMTEGKKVYLSDAIDVEDDTVQLRIMDRNITKPHIIDKLEKELDKKGSTRVSAVFGAKKERHWGSRSDFGRVRENKENAQDQNLKAKFKLHQDNAGETYHHLSEEITTDISRHRWKQSRQRPRRPGADALISKPIEKILRRSSAASLTLDHEDMEQLFRDTGFHRHWKKQSFQ